MTNQNDRIAKLEAAIAELQEMVNVCEMDRNRALAEIARLRPLAEIYPLAWEECRIGRAYYGEPLTDVHNSHDEARRKAGLDQ
jgi:hypothetical protein